jgi:hypothetical protein
MGRCSRRIADPRVDVLGLCSSAEGRYLFYREDTERVELELRSMKASARAVAVDARRPYEERDLGEISPGIQTFEAPYRSDWAVAVGSFDRAPRPRVNREREAPIAPSDLVVESGSARSVDLAFRDRSDDERGFELERAVSRGGTPGAFERIATLPAGTTRFSDPSLRPETQYWYRARAVNERGTSSYTATLSVFPALDGALVVDLRPVSLRLSRLKAGEPYYVDRDYTIRKIPPLLERAIWIQTVNDDKEIDAERFVTFRITRPMTVYVGFDRRAKKRPAWLEEWERLPERIDVDRDGMGYFELFRREVPAGVVTLGGNSAPPAEWGGEGRSHYVVALVARPSP